MSDSMKFIASLIESFDEADKNKDGRLSYPEVSAILTKKGITSSQAYKIFDAADKDKNFYLSKEEFGAGVEKIPPTEQKEASLRSLFDELDADKSGYISKLEIIDVNAKAGGVIPEDKIHDLIIGVSKDSNGKVSYEEFLHIVGVETAGNELKEIFTKLDVDKNGSLTSSEIFAAVAKDVNLIKYLVTIQGIVNSCAKSGGSLTYEEFVKAWDAQKPKFTSVK